MKVITLLQKQLQNEASRGWDFACIPRAWDATTDEEGENALVSAKKHPVPAITIPDPIFQGARPMFPEMFFSVYAGQSIEVKTISCLYLLD